MYIFKSPKTTAAPMILSGRSLACSQAGARQRAALGAQLVLGEIEIEWTQTQAAALVGASAHYIAAALHLPPDHRAGLAEGQHLPFPVVTTPGGAVVAPVNTGMPAMPAPALSTAVVYSDADLRRIAAIVGAPAMMRAAIETELQARAVEADAEVPVPA